MANEPDPPEELTRAGDYRRRAEEIRALATNGVDPTTKTALLKIADDYDAMALTRDSINSTNSAIEAGRRKRG